MHGHFYQMVPLAWALRCAGHDVLVVAPSNFLPVIAEAGLPPASSGSAVTVSQMIGTDRAGRRVAWQADSAARIERSGAGFGRLAAHCLDGTLAIAKSWRPDLVISEPTEYTGPMAAAACSLPWVEHGWGIAVSPHYRQAAAAELRPERDRLGLASLPLPDLVIDVCPRSLQDRNAPAGQPMRYLPYNGPAKLPPWLGRDGRLATGVPHDGHGPACPRR